LHNITAVSIAYAGCTSTDARPSSPAPPERPTALVFLLPWRSLWTTNAWINYWPGVANFLAQGWVRGLVSGLGLLNIWIGLAALTRRRRA
jgi:hypothetical protein